jgi:hypothetical protein
VTTEDEKVVITIPEGTEKIDVGEFKDTNGFHKVILPSSLVEIGCFAFYNCSDLVEIEIPGGVKELKFQTFEECKNLQKVVLNEGLEKISWGVFANTPALEELNIPSTVISMGDEFRDTFNCCDLSPFETMYGNKGCGIRKSDITIACPDRFDDKCFKGTKED